MTSHRFQAILLSPFLFALSLVFIGCDRSPSSTPKPPQAAQAATDPLPDHLFLTQAPTTVQDLTAARKGAHDGDSVTVRGRIGGRSEPFAAGRAEFMLVDPAIKSCADEKDGCPTPWDYCCEPPETLATNSAIVQILGPDGQPLKANLQDQHNLKPLAEVIVTGKLRKTPDNQSAVIDATTLYVKS